MGFFQITNTCFPSTKNIYSLIFWNYITHFLRVINLYVDIIEKFSKISNSKQNRNHNLLISFFINILKYSDYFNIIHLNGINRSLISRKSLCYGESIVEGRSYINENLDISYCSFSRSALYSDSGGVIYINGGSLSLLASNLMFWNCSSSKWGGAIFFNSENSTLKMICANKCTCGNSYSGHFSYLKALNMNNNEYLSLSYCSISNIGYWTIWMDSGNQRVDRTNISLNKAFWGSGIGVGTPSSFISSHCTISNNIAEESICIRFGSNSGVMSFSNIIYNTSPTIGIVYVDGGGVYIMEYCIFDQNQEILFCLWSGSLSVSHSFISHLGSFITSSTAVSTSLNNSIDIISPFEARITYQIHYFGSHYCAADNQITFQNTVDATCSKTLEESPINTIFESIEPTLKETIHRSYEEVFCSCQKEKKVMKVIFSFSFVYPLLLRF